MREKAKVKSLPGSNYMKMKTREKNNVAKSTFGKF